MQVNIANRVKFPLHGARRSLRVCSTALVTSFISALLISTVFGGSALAATLPRIEGEYAKPDEARSKAAARLPFMGNAAMQTNFTAIDFPAISTAKIEAVKKSNSVGDAVTGAAKPALQIGISRTLRDELPNLNATPVLRWTSLTDGSKLAYLRVTSPAAKAIRVGLAVGNVPVGTEIRFSGEANSSVAAAIADKLQLTTLNDAHNIYWTPLTEGDIQLIEIFVPRGAEPTTLKFSVEAVSHIFATPSQKFTDAKAFGDCNVDAVCASPTEGYLNAKNAVAMISFQADNGQGGVTSATFMCTATLLNDNDPTTQTPYLLTSNRCVSSQASANTLTSFWFYENTTCANPRVFDVGVTNATIVNGGAAFLVSDFNNDSAFLRMNNLAPGGVFFSGWDANPIAVGEAISVLHHSLGDPKRLTLGSVERFRNDFSGLTGTFTSPTYTTGTTSPGSGGAGLLTTTNGEYFLRGTLVGGPATCENRNQTANQGNYAYYSRFDQIYPAIKRFINKDTTPPNFTDIWWGGAAESGWGIQITQHASGNIFGTWYTYDQAGNQLFIVMSGCDLIPLNGNICSGRLYRTTGTPFNSTTFSGATTTYIGNGTFTFTDANNATFDYTINASATNNATTIRKQITRFPFGTGVAAFPNDASDIYYQADASGWGYSLAQHGGAAFGVIYHYDENRNPMFLTMYMPAYNGNPGGSSSATLYRTRSNGGSHFLTPDWRASDISNVPVGGSGIATVSTVTGGLNLMFTVSTGLSGSSSYTQIRSITKIPF